MSLPVAQLGWMAGIIDLKGKITRKRNKARATQQIVLAVDSKHWQVIRELGRMTGTAPEMQKAPPKHDWYRRNCSEHCEEAHTLVEGSEWPSIGRWTITGASMATVLWNLRPFLRVENGLEEAMLEAFDQAVLTGQGSAQVLASLRRLKELGWDIPPQLETGEEQHAA